MWFRLIPSMMLAVWLTVSTGAGSASPLAGGRGAAPDEAAVTMGLLPEPLRGVAQGINRVQADFSRRMTAQLQTMRDEGSMVAGAWLCLIAFAYGVLHAAGPGHGKLAVSSYFLANRAQPMRGVLLSAGAAAMQGLAAILLVGVPVVLLDMTRAAAMGQLRYLELGSYGLMTLVGLLLLLRAMRGDIGCDHGGCTDAQGSGAHHHGHRHSHGRAAGRDGLGGVPENERAGFTLLALAVGCRPCSGAVLVLLFALANGMVPAGFLAVLAMAVGVALTTSAAGLVGIGVRHGLSSLAARNQRSVALVERGMAVSGAVAITLVGGLLFLAALNGV